MTKSAGRTMQRLAAVLTAVVLSTTLATVFAATPAQAAVDCAGPSNRPNGEGYVKTYASVPLRVGPYGACDTISHIPADRLFWIHCNFINDYDNHWMYGRVGGTSTYGWLYLSSDVEYLWQDEDGDHEYDYEICT